MPYLRYKVVPCRRRRKLKATACFLEFCFYFHVVVHFRKDKSLRLQYFTFVGDLWCTIEKIRSESFRKCSFCKSAQNIPSIMLRVINKAPVLLGHNTPDYDIYGHISGHIWWCNYCQCKTNAELFRLFRIK